MFAHITCLLSSCLLSTCLLSACLLGFSALVLKMTPSMPSNVKDLVIDLVFSQGLEPQPNRRT